MDLNDSLALNRARRSTIGNRMREILSEEFQNQESIQEEEPNEDFTENEEVQSDNEACDESESDFENDGIDEHEEVEEDEPMVSEGEEEGEDNLRKRSKVQEKDKKCLSGTYYHTHVKENILDEETQLERLAEAKITAARNTEDLKRYENMEVERRKRQANPVSRKPIEGPIIRTVSKLSDDRTRAVEFMSFPELKTFEKLERPKKKAKKMPHCVVSGKSAKYRDPVTGLHYANANAFKKLRANPQKYEKKRMEAE
ncbi:YL1 nuclear protein domain-containing protein [Ditylenchus destructor]|uniref:Vacuolar protein sorting-associated protein 72 homolog n=1 Tax=Ditylenchus destructor TaxID=166010 RepID=A0AAD4QYS4_9BILA|nr:YL1 nuclear protein domain-containing protein [Ditylenchus destructor]